jgi:replication factor C subunit 2/4
MMTKTHEIWLEKHRPKFLDDVVGNEHIVKRLRQLRDSQCIPNMILTGPPGCGKTTSILALCREILGPKYQEATLELNASDDRGIDVVRTRVKEFAEKVVKLP